MSGVNKYIIAIFDEKHKKYQNISIFYFIFLDQRCTIISITSYIHGTCQLFSSQNNASSFPNKITPTGLVNNVITFSDNPKYNITPLFVIAAIFL